MVNYFDYGYAQPKGPHPIAVHLEHFDCPWAEGHSLVRIGLKAREMEKNTRPAANLVLLIDVSGSMNQFDKLPWVKASLHALVRQLEAQDRVAVVVYAGASGLALPSTAAGPPNREAILTAIDRLQAGGTTNGAAGIQTAYRIARENFIDGGINRVVLATDGDFNVGVTSGGELTELVSSRAKSGVFLSVLGFGRGNLNDAMMERITNRGNGGYFYIDNLAEAKRVLCEEMTETLVTVAGDVKIQVEFNPAKIARFRLIAYSNRQLEAEDFSDDEVDAGEIGAGGEVTALYQIELGPAAAEDAGLRYQARTDLVPSEEWGFVSLRYQPPAGGKSHLIQTPILGDSKQWNQATEASQFASAVALFGMLLRKSEHAGTGNLELVDLLARAGAQTEAQRDFLRMTEGFPHSMQ